MKYLLILLFTLSNQVFSSMTCDDLVLRTKRKSETINLCFNDSVNTLMTSNCLEKKCSLFDHMDKKKEFLKDYEVNFQLGNPQIYLCVKLGNYAEVATVEVKNKEYKITICRKGEDLIDTGSYFMHMSRFLK